MIFTSNILTAASVILFAYLPSASALPAISSYSGTEARSLSKFAPTTNAKSSSAAWALDRRSTVKTYTGKSANKKTFSNTNAYKATGGTPYKAKSKVQSKPNQGANGRPPARQRVQPNRKVPANNMKRPDGVRPPPAGRVPRPSRKMPANNWKQPKGDLDPSQVKEKPKNVGKVFKNPHHGTKSAIYAMSLGQTRYEEPEESSENDNE